MTANVINVGRPQSSAAPYIRKIYKAISHLYYCSGCGLTWNIPQTPDSEAILAKFAGKKKTGVVRRHCPMCDKMMVHKQLYKEPDLE